MSESASRTMQSIGFTGNSKEPTELELSEGRMSLWQEVLQLRSKVVEVAERNDRLGASNETLANENVRLQQELETWKRYVEEIVSPCKPVFSKNETTGEGHIVLILPYNPPCGNSADCPVDSCPVIPRTKCRGYKAP